MELTIQKQASPIFFQYISDFLFKELVKQRHPLLPDSKDSPQQLPQLDYEEENAVRYAAGYVVKHLRKKIERSSNKLKENLFVCLEGMCERDDEEDPSTSWTTLISRGCLKLVNSNSYRVFFSIDYVVSIIYGIMRNISEILESAPRGERSAI